MFGQAKKVVFVVAVVSAFAVASFAFGGLTSKPSDAGAYIDRTVRLTAVEDAAVSSANPALNQASNTRLVAETDDGARIISYLKFAITRAEIGKGAIVGTKVLLTTQQPIATNVQLRAVSSSEWSEQNLTFKNAPPVGGVVGPVSQGEAGTRWIDVSSVVTAPGIYSFALTADAGTARFASSEASMAPELLVRMKSKKRGVQEEPDGGGDPTTAPSPNPTNTGPKPDPDPTTNPGQCKARFPGDPCAGRMYYGASTEGGDPRDLEARAGRSLGLFRSYMQEGSPTSRFVSRASADVAAGRIPLISTKVPGSWADVAAGRQDAWLVERIKGLAAVDGPVWLTLHHEPRSDGDPADWVDMQQHARTLIDRHASNIALVGILNGWDFLEKNGNPERWRMPVGTGVHVMGYDNYNPYTPNNGSDWKTVEEVMSPGLAIQQWGYPTLIGETGVHDDPRAAAWIRDQYAYGIAHGFVAISYFDSTANSVDGGWTLTGARLNAFKQNLGEPTVARIPR